MNENTYRQNYIINIIQIKLEQRGSVQKNDKVFYPMRENKLAVRFGCKANQEKDEMKILYLFLNYLTK